MMPCSRWNRAALLAGLSVLLAGCGSASRNLASKKELSGGLWSMRVTSPVLSEGQPIPPKYTADGDNVSPPLKWSHGPSGTSEYVLIVEDADSDRKIPAMHWMVYRLPVGTNELPENAAATGNLVQGRNYKGQNTYTGPDPKKGNTHHYHFQIFALDQSLTLPPGATRPELGKALKRGAIAKGKLVATYTR
jgi:Raf kinase inhibitor-like YbhB/YbcL family protein